MKVIYAGFSKTGTKSMQAALTELGYNVYDFMEQYKYQGKEWMKIFKYGGTTEDFRKMFENVDAVTDMPACYFWDEIHKAFPDAKIVLCLRDSEDEWAKSVGNEAVSEARWLILIGLVFSPTLRRLREHKNYCMYSAFGTTYNKESLFKTPHYNQMLTRMHYRRHNAHVLQNAPKDKLLVYNVKEGWEPLCKFLGVDVPSKPFPHRNKKGSIVDEYLESNPVLIRAQREIIFFVALLIVIISVASYMLIALFNNDN
ncbi:uncharacterized protein LOC143461604 isoform X3 [Clavelina lepadiformis]|uniref:uncharacterized protein LOC143461604 isoform X3 n=1 Tax=Clavelina lepadiformis TaxID=159417 RepID=UPI0040420976